METAKYSATKYSLVNQPCLGGFWVSRKSPCEKSVVFVGNGEFVGVSSVEELMRYSRLLLSNPGLVHPERIDINQPPALKACLSSGHTINMRTLGDVAQAIHDIRKWLEATTPGVLDTKMRMVN
jgi:hypothetical protein